MTAQFRRHIPVSSLQDYVQGKPFSFVYQQGTSQLVTGRRSGLFVQDEMRVRPGLSIALGLRYDWQNYISNPRTLLRVSHSLRSGEIQEGRISRWGRDLLRDYRQAAIADVLRFNGQNLTTDRPLASDLSKPITAGGVAQTLPDSIVRFAPDLRLPYNLQYSFGVETQLQKSTTFTATYVGMRGFDLFRSRDLNAPLPPLYVQRPDPEIGTLREIESAGT